MFTIAKVKCFNPFFFMSALIGTQYPSSRATRYILPGEFYGEQIEKLREANADLAKEG